jgi:hypothetical protein
MFYVHYRPWEGSGSGEVNAGVVKTNSMPLPPTRQKRDMSEAALCPTKPIVVAQPGLPASTV